MSFAEFNLLSILSDGKSHPINQLCETLQINSEQLNDLIQELRTLGLSLLLTTLEGYCIPQGLELLNRQLIKKYCSAKSFKQLNELIVLTSVDSTNTYLVEELKNKSASTIACFAEYQTAGKGRRGRHWITPFASSINCSLAWHFSFASNDLLGLTLAVAVIVVETLKEYGIQDLHLKWPNDILWRGRKLAGILVDIIPKELAQCTAIIGVGINGELNAKQASEIDQPWVDLHTITHEPLRRNQLAGLLLDHLIAGINEFISSGFIAFKDRWLALDQMTGKTVTLYMPSRSVSGVMEGISDHGELIVLDHNGQIHQYLSGELSLRMDT